MGIRSSQEALMLVTRQLAADVECLTDYPAPIVLNPAGAGGELALTVNNAIIIQHVALGLVDAHGDHHLGLPCVPR